MKLNKRFFQQLLAAIQLFSSLALAQSREHIRDVSQLPLVFEINRGQTDQRARFLSRGNGYTLFLTPAEVLLSLRRQTNRTRGESKTPVDRRSDLVRVSLLESYPSPEVTGLDELSGKSNYFIGSDPKKWKTNIPVFARVKYQSVYPGIDLIYYGNQGHLEHDFVVAPGADPRKITLSIRGAREARVDSHGDLLLSIHEGTVCLHRPRVYQDAGEGRQLILGRYVDKGSHRFGFEIGEYDAKRPLIIDPVLSYSTYLGGAGGDFAYGIAVDSAGSAYVTGATGSANFPTAGPIQASIGDTRSDDVFVTKLSASGGALVYSTYLGGSGEDVGLGIAVDAAGSAYVTGQTASANFPTNNPLQPNLSGTSDAFVTKLNPAGNALAYSTYLGGSGDDIGNGIAVDSAGNAYATGATDSTNFPITAGAWQTTPGASSSCGAPPNTFPCEDGFVTKLNAAGDALVYSTYLAGSHDESGNGIALDSSGNAYVAGFTDSIDFQTTPNALQTGSGGGYDAFVVKLNAGGTGPVYSTYLGGSADDDGAAIAIDASGSVYMTGSTGSANFPTKNAFQAALTQGTPLIDAYVAKFDPAGALAYSTYLGGSSRDLGFAIAVDSFGNAYVTGRTDSADFPMERPILSSVGGGPGHAFVTKLNATGNALVYSTYLGGSSGRDRPFGIAVDSSRKVYVTGFTNATSYPTTPGAYQAANQGMDDAFVTKIDDTAPDFTLAVAGGSNSASINCGQTANYNLQIVSFNGFAGAVGISCSVVGSAQGLTCRPSADSVNVAGGSTPFGVSVMSTGRSFLLPTASFGRSDDERIRPMSVAILALLMLSILVGVFTTRVRHVTARLSAAGGLVVFFLLAAQLAGCFGKGGGNHAQPGTYTVTVTATNQTIARTVNLDLTVDCPH